MNPGQKQDQGLWARFARTLQVALVGLMLLACGDDSAMPSDAEPGDTQASDAPSADAAGGVDAAEDSALRDGGVVDISTPRDAARPPPTMLEDLPAPSTLWVEPFSLAPGVVPRRGAPVELNDVSDWVAAAHRRGFQRLVIAYVEYAGCFYYPSEIRQPFPSAFPPFLEGPADPCLVDGEDCFIPADGPCAFLPPGDLLETLLAEADALEMEVFLGLGQSGDPYLLLNIESQLRATGVVDEALAARLSSAFRRSTAIAEELIGRYGDHESFVGFYLGHEPSCIDVALNLWTPVREELTRVAPSKRVLISPFQRLESCFSADSVATHIASLALHAVLYQDAVGAGYDESAAHHTCTDGPRESRISELERFYRGVREDHAGTSTAVWANIEAWTMTGYGRDGAPTLGNDPSDGECGYGNAHAGPYERFARQYRAAFVGGVDAAMVNEGLLLFDGTDSMSLSDPFEASPAMRFSGSYDRALR